MNWVSTTTKDGDGGGSTITGSCAWPPTAFWRLSEAVFPPLSLLPSSSPLRYPRISSRGALPARVERHNPASMATRRAVCARTLVVGLPYCPTCGANGTRSGQFVTQ